MKQTYLLGAVIVALGAGFYLWTAAPTTEKSNSDANPMGAALVEIVIPENLSQNAQIGKAGFEAKCAACHGLNAVGQDGVAPPLIHKIYEPSHHGDESFQRAAASGVRAHHWRFGDMLPVEGVTRNDVAMIITYVRELQRVNGIN